MPRHVPCTPLSVSSGNMRVQGVSGSVDARLCDIMFRKVGELALAVIFISSVMLRTSGVDAAVVANRVVSYNSYDRNSLHQSHSRTHIFLIQRS